METGENGAAENNGRFLPGHPPTPGGGRPKGSLSLTKILREYLEEIPPGEKKSRAQQFVEMTLERAKKGDKVDKKIVWNYIDGLPRQNVDLTSGGKPIPILGGITNTDVPVDDGDAENSETP